MLNLNSITKKYNNRMVLDNLSLSVKLGDTIAIEGPSGSGKSTLLNICGALDRGDSGDVELDSINYKDLGDNKLAIIRNRDIGFVFQEHLLLPQCSVIENVLIPTIPLKVDMYENAKELLEYVGLSDRADSSVLELSTGEKQRVAVARALINRPKLLLADEPTGSLDSKNSENLGILLQKLNKDMELTIICVTHSRDFAKYMHKRYSLIDGKLEDNNVL